MKNYILVIMAAVLVALPTMAQQQEWQSTSTMQTSGSSLAPQVTAVGATSVGDMNTTNSSAKAPGRLRKSFDNTTNPGFGNPSSPIGDAMVPLLLMSVVFGGVIAVRRKRNAISK